MARKSANAIYGQQLLFSEAGSMTWQEREESPMLAAYYEAKADGVPMIDLLDRSERLIAALTEMGRMSSVGRGFLTAVHTPHVTEIDISYGRFGTPKVARNARDKLPRREKRIRKLLAPVVGFEALRNSIHVLMPLEEINARAVHEWEVFQDTFQGPPNRGRRDNYRQVLSKQRTQQIRLRKRLGIEIVPVKYN